MSQKVAKTDGPDTGSSVSCERVTLSAKAELQNSFQASEDNFGLDPTQPTWLSFPAFVIQVLTSPWITEIFLQLMSCHQAFQLLPSNLSELEEAEEAWTIQVFSHACSTTSQWKLRCWLERALYQVQNEHNNLHFFKSNISFLELSASSSVALHFTFLIK